MAEVPIGDVAGAVLIEAARDAAAHAHAPYSRFAVGAALLLDDGSIITGANFENASYGLSLCAETVAVASANTAGRMRDIVAVGVIGGTRRAGMLDGADPVRPCGRCRQVLTEAADLGGRDIIVYCASGDGSRTERFALSDLLPHAFGPASLNHD